MSLIELHEVTKTFGSKIALDNVSFSINKGEIFGFLGPNGAGKSTTIRCMMGLIFPDSGQIQINGTAVNKSSSSYREKIGYVPSDLELNNLWSGKDHISYIQNARGISEFPTALVERLGLDLNEKSKQLSTGNRQKLAFVLALFTKPDILILDEPTKGLDPLFQELVYQILAEFKEDGGCVFFSSHNLTEVERLCDRIGIIRAGKIVANETMDSLRHMHIHEVQAVFAEVETVPDLSGFGEIMRSSNNSVTLRVEGTLNPILETLSRHALVDLSIDHASLEETFLHFYEDKK